MNSLLRFKKFKIVLVVGRGRASTSQVIFDMAKTRTNATKSEIEKLGLFDVLRNDIIIISCDGENISRKDHAFLYRLLSRASFSLLVVTHIGDPHPDTIIFSGEKEKGEAIRSFIKSLPRFHRCIFNIDDECVVELEKSCGIISESFGFGENAEFRASDMVVTESPDLGINFKINHKGKIIPVWLKGLFGKEYLYAALAAAASGSVFDMNLVEVSQALVHFHGLPGRMQLVQGTRKTMILDDSDSASVFSMAEALEIEGRIKAKRKIAVLGDVVGVGKYAIEAHESLGERAQRSIDLLFTVGARAKLIAEGAKNKGFPENAIFSFDTVQEAVGAVKERIQEGDLILVDGSKEMRMGELVRALRSS
jgi:UDP-N-acetylmuramoyl-tripeptide--D-alanyl-D-alanine ligase